MDQWHDTNSLTHFHECSTLRRSLLGTSLCYHASRSHLRNNGQPMKFISICRLKGIVEYEILSA